MVAESDFGPILVDAEGKTLYMFKPDTAGEPTCYDDCETNWPPLVVTGDITVGEGLDAATFTTVARTDGSTQVKAGAWPLYYFANDAAAGDVNGQGQGDVWYVVSPPASPSRSSSFEQPRGPGSRRARSMAGPPASRRSRGGSAAPPSRRPPVR